VSAAVSGWILAQYCSPVFLFDHVSLFKYSRNAFKISKFIETSEKCKLNFVRILVTRVVK
jgi:hypothetical protein